MKKQFVLDLSANLLGSTFTSVRAEGIPLKHCPEPVRRTIDHHARPGRVDGVNAVHAKDRLLYVVEVERPGAGERMLHVSGEGDLLRIVDEIGLRDLPRPVKAALHPFLGEGNRFEGADRVTWDQRTEYHVDFDLSDEVDLHLVIGESGEILRHREEADF
ncbi:MAG: hypothetical protein JNJ70_21300 [Verrucomicrobiales bacterium]|nr:hypothetical protein [Verrucomicrobiales bacterium]